MVVGVLMMFISFILHYVNTVTLMLSMFFIMMGLPMVFSTATVMALIGYDDKATGSAIMSFITMFVALIATLILTLLPNENPLVLPSLFIVVMILAVLTFRYAAKTFSDV